MAIVTGAAIDLLGNLSLVMRLAVRSIASYNRATSTHTSGPGRSVALGIGRTG